MIPNLIFVLLSLGIPSLALLVSGLVERIRRQIVERELGFWDANIVSALNGGSVQ